MDVGPRAELDETHSLAALEPVVLPDRADDAPGDDTGDLAHRDLEVAIPEHDLVSLVLRSPRMQRRSLGLSRSAVTLWVGVLAMIAVLIVLRVF